MGTEINCLIEYDEVGEHPFEGDCEVMPLSNWGDLSGAKDYKVFAALSGIRGECDTSPLYSLRGLPRNPSRQTLEEIDSRGNGVGWLQPSEVAKALSHFEVSKEEISLEMECVLRLLEFFTSKVGNERVRFVFQIE